MLVQNKRKILDPPPSPPPPPCFPLGICIKAFQEAGTVLGQVHSNVAINESTKLGIKIQSQGPTTKT